MKVREYLNILGIDTESYSKISFVIGEVIGEGHTKQFMYRSSPCRTAHEWFSFDCEKKGNSVLDYNIMNTKQPVVSWMSGADWNPAINRNMQMSLLVVSDEELYKYYSKEQGSEMIEFIGKKIKQNIEAGNDEWYNKKH